jgi:hypothetical protein
MKKTSYIVSILLSLTSGVLFLILFSSILGGVFEDRTCQTDCMTLLYWSTISAAIISVILSFVAKDNYLSKKVFIIFPLISFGIIGILITILGVAKFT